MNNFITLKYIYQTIIYI